MCDYSLERVASRPAQVGDQLVVSNFENGFTRGFADIHDRNTAVCLRPGTELAFESVVRYQSDSFFPWSHRAPSNLACFRQINKENPQTNHDALELTDGTVVLLTRLHPRQRAVVLQLPCEQSLGLDSIILDLERLSLAPHQVDEKTAQ